MILKWNIKFNDAVLKEGLIKYGADSNSENKLLGRQNVIYSIRINNKSYVMRFSSGLRTNSEELEAEISWILYLKSKGMSVAAPIPSKAGNYIEMIETRDARFYVVVFEFAEGEYAKVNKRDDKLFYDTGKYVGRLHSLTKDYIPSKKLIKRPSWEESRLFYFLEMNVPLSESKIYSRLDEARETIKSFERDKNSYGLIHGDIHYRNFNLEGDKITLFDFDDCEYGHFIKDISTLIFYTYEENHDCRDKKAFILDFLKSFFKGYYEENNLDEKWIKSLAPFLKLREIILYAMVYHYESFDVCSPWIIEYMRSRKEKIEKGLPTIEDVNFEKLDIKNLIAKK